MKIKNDQDLVEAVRQLYILKDLEHELEEKIDEVNNDIHDYLRNPENHIEK